MQLNLITNNQSELLIVFDYYFVQLKYFYVASVCSHVTGNAFIFKYESKNRINVQYKILHLKTQTFVYGVTWYYYLPQKKMETVGWFFFFCSERHKLKYFIIASLKAYIESKLEIFPSTKRFWNGEWLVLRMYFFTRRFKDVLLLQKTKKKKGNQTWCLQI